jgi:hypothetical protein
MSDLLCYCELHRRLTNVAARPWFPSVPLNKHMTAVPTRARVGEHLAGHRC